MKEIKLKVLKVQVVTNATGSDMISFDIEATKQYPDVSYIPCVNFNTRRGYGAAWVKENFPELIGMINVTNAKTGERTVL